VSPSPGPRPRRPPERDERRPTGLAAVAIVWLAAALVLESDAGIPLYASWGLNATGLLIVLAWMFRARRLLSSGQHDRLVRGRSASRVLTWAMPPLAIVVALLCAWSDMPLRLRLILGQGPLLRHALALRDDPTLATEGGGHEFGIFAVHESSVVAGQVRLITTACGSDFCGLVYSPDGAPLVVSRDSYRHLWGPWWHWRQREP
jgi:hypothetical protein